MTLEFMGCLQCGQHEEILLKFMELYKHVSVLSCKIIDKQNLFFYTMWLAIKRKSY